MRDHEPIEVITAILIALFFGMVIYLTLTSNTSDDPGPAYSNTYDCNSVGC